MKSIRRLIPILIKQKPKEQPEPKRFVLLDKDGNALIDADGKLLMVRG